MKPVDKRNRFEEEVFSYQVRKGDKVIISWCGKQVTILKGKKAAEFLKKVEGLGEKETQLIMAKLTGNFKRGNEKLARNRKY